ncbi:YhaN family protein [Roseiconus lacunae]|uniref:AAA family ATPase n=1 Tax=Roseiconus lacunae TaxID=2605694 RepID=A0ABT7PRN4_9BACT|nr:YhaN family protein [Roseiconus lacunae]MDM4018781.1 AAA family ATPase [Roseiconus lacunae]
MLIERLDLLAFGGFTNHALELAAEPRKFHLIYGPNESGKSTCLRAITALLFGIPNQTTDNYLHPNAKLRVGATLRVGDDERLQFIRRKGRKNTELKADGTTPLAPEELTRALGGIDEQTFHHRFALSHEHLVEGGKAILESRGELGEILFAAGAGVGKLRSILSQLETEERDLYAARARKAAINAALSELEQKRSEIRDLQTPPAEYRSVCDRIEQSEAKAEQLNGEQSESRQQLSRNQSFREALKYVPLWRHAQQRLEQLHQVPSLDDDFAARRREANANRAAKQTRVEELRAELESHLGRLQELKTDAAILENADQVVSLFQSIATREVADTERVGLQRLLDDQRGVVCRVLSELDVDLPEGASVEAIEEAVERHQLSDSVHARIGELAGDYEVVRQQEQDASDRLRTIRRELGEIDEDLENSPTSGDPHALEAVLTEIGQPRDLLSQLDQQQSTFSDAERECQQLLQALGFSDRSIKEATAFVPPTTAQLDQFEESFAEARRELDHLNDQRTSKSQRQQSLRQQLASLQTKQVLPTEQELSDQRERRDQAVDRLSMASTDEARIEMSQQTRREIRLADQVVDTLRSQQQKVLQAETLRIEIAAIDEEIALCEREIETATAATSALTTRWESLWQDKGVAPGTLKEMRQWLGRLDSLVEKAESLSQCQSQLSQSEEKLKRVKARLGNAVTLAWSMRPVMAGNLDAATPIPGDLDLETLHDTANGLRQELWATAERRNRIQSKRDELAAEVPRAEAKLESCRKRRQQWEEQWRAATSNVISDSLATPAVVNARIKRIQELFQAKRDHDATVNRIAAIQRDHDAFHQHVKSIAAIVGQPTTGTQNESDLAQTLYQRLQAAKESDRERQRLTKVGDEIRAKLDHVTEGLRQDESAIAELCHEAGVTSVEDLPEVEKLAQEKRCVQTEFESIQKQLVMLAGQTNLDDFVAEVESQNPSELEENVDRLSRRLDELSKQRTEIEQHIGGLKRDRERIDGSDRAASLNQELQMVLGRISRHAEQWARLRIASLVMRQAIDHYRRANESPVLNIACRAFSDLTLERYTGLRPEYDDKDRWSLVGVEHDTDGIEKTVPVEMMSDGTRDSVFLAMRLASIEHQLSSGRTFPVIVDDCLIQLDDARAAAGLRLFSTLSEKTQVLMFTHHEHVLDLAASTLAPDQYHVHRLPS